MNSDKKEDFSNYTNGDYENLYCQPKSSSNGSIYPVQQNFSKNTDINSNNNNNNDDNFQPKNKSCPLCQKNIDYNSGSNSQAIIYVPNCQHIYHAKCGDSFISNDIGSQCPTCKNRNLKNFYQDQDHEEEGVPIDHGNNADLTKFLHRKYGKKQSTISEEEKYDEQYWRKQYGSRSLSVLQKSKILRNIKNPLKFPKEIDMTILQENQTNMEDILKSGANILDIYFSMNITQWQELVDLQMHKSDLVAKEGKFMPLDILIDLYSIDYNNLIDNLEMDLNDMVEMQMSSKELERLQLDFDQLINLELTKNQFKDFHFSIEDCVNDLKMETKHLFELGIKSSPDFISMKWDCNIAIRQMGMNAKDIEGLGITDTLVSLQRRREVKKKQEEKVKSQQQTRTRTRNQNSQQQIRTRPVNQNSMGVSMAMAMAMGTATLLPPTAPHYNNNNNKTKKSKSNSKKQPTILSLDL